MLKREPWLVITDLDGTLLDHHTYSFVAAQTSLDELANRNIPVIINSSKTLAEINHIKQALGITTPCIVENGSAIIQHNLPPIVLGVPRETILTALNSLPSSIKKHYRSFNDCSISDIADMTGLSDFEAKNALDRCYSEPLQWLANTHEREKFINYIEKLGLSVLAGGRFLHVMGSTDKGQASLKLKQLYTSDQHPTTIALGDSHNDIAMLEASDIAVIVRNNSSSTPKVNHHNQYHTKKPGPTGWAEAINKFVLA